MALTVGMIYLVGLAVQTVGLVLHIVGLATPVWSTVELIRPDVGKVKTTVGLWELCVEALGQSECDSIPNDQKTSALEAAEAFAIIGLVFGVVALLLALLYVVLPMIGKTASARQPLLSAGVAFFAFVCVLICVIVYGVKFYKDTLKPGGYDLGYSFGLSIAGGVLMAVGGGLVLRGGREQSTDEERRPFKS